MSDTVEQIKSRLDIVDVISGYLKIQRAGANWKARCPFHNEKTPSFHISPERQSWHCFGCNRGGDMFSFVQESEGIEFIEALRILAARAGVPMTEHRPSGEASAGKDRPALLAVAERSAKFFERQLWSGTAGAKALNYLRGRGMTDDTIKAWRLGWAPNDWRALTGFLQQEGYPDRSIIGAGMAVDREGRPYDRFRSRIMFPINDANGQVVGFTGRAFGATVAPDGVELAKYVNTPQTAIYDKSRVLFGLDKAKTEMRASSTALLVEGNVDAVMSWQAGVRNVVATSGTALTPQQLKMLSRHAKTLDFCFDTDQAGQTATRRGIGLALAQEFTVRILTIADATCKDPADYVAKYGSKWSEVVAGAKPAIQHYYDQVMADFDQNSAESKKAIIASLGPLVRRLVSRVEQSHWANQLATVLRTDVRAVEADLAHAHDDIGQTEREIPATLAMKPGPVTEPLDPTSLEILALITRAPELAAQVVDAADGVDPRVAQFIRNPQLLQEPHLAGGQAGESQHLIDMASMQAEELWAGRDVQELKAQAAMLVASVSERSIRKRRADLEPSIRDAELRRDAKGLNELLKQFHDYSEELNCLQATQASPYTS